MGTLWELTVIERSLAIGAKGQALKRWNCPQEDRIGWIMRNTAKKLSHMNLTDKNFRIMSNSAQFRSDTTTRGEAAACKNSVKKKSLLTGKESLADSLRSKIQTLIRDRKAGTRKISGWILPRFGLWTVSSTNVMPILSRTSIFLKGVRQESLSETVQSLRRMLSSYPRKR